MVLESLITAQMAEKKPIKMLPLSILYSSVGVLLALWIFPGNNLALIAFTVIAMIPLMVSIMRFEEEKEETQFELRSNGPYRKKLSVRESKELIPLSAHKHIFPFFLYIFIGLVISFAVWFMALPHDTVARLFSSQISTISQVATSITGHAISGDLTLIKIFLNNLRVLAFALVFSLLYGAGAIFIITWNASLVGVTIANSVRTVVAAGSTAGYFGAFSLGMAKYLTHGIPEILAYFIAALAGGIISVALVKKQFGTPKFTHALLDAFTLITISVFILLVAAAIEITISPLIPA